MRIGSFPLARLTLAPFRAEASGLSVGLACVEARLAAPIPAREQPVGYGTRADVCLLITLSSGKALRISAHYPGHSGHDIPETGGSAWSRGADKISRELFLRCER